MKSSVSPAVLAVVIILAVAALGFAGWKYLGPGNAAGSASEDLKPVKIDLTKIKPGDMEQVKKDLEAAGATRAGIAGGGSDHRPAQAAGKN